MRRIFLTLPNRREKARPIPPIYSNAFVPAPASKFAVAPGQPRWHTGFHIPDDMSGVKWPMPLFLPLGLWKPGAIGCVPMSSPATALLNLLNTSASRQEWSKRQKVGKLGEKCRMIWGTEDGEPKWHEWPYLVLPPWSNASLPVRRATSRDVRRITPRSQPSANKSNLSEKLTIAPSS